MTRDELTGLMARVAVALNRRPNTFTIDARPFGDEGWAVFVDGDFDTAWLEVVARRDTEEDAYELAWLKVCCKMHDEEKRMDNKIRELERQTAPARLALEVVRKAILVEKDRPAGAFAAGTAQ